MRSQQNHRNQISRREFLKFLGVSTGAAFLAGCSGPSLQHEIPSKTLTPTLTLQKVEFRLCFNVKYPNNPDENPKGAGEFNPIRGVSGIIDPSLGYQTYTYKVSEIKNQLEDGNTMLESIGIIPDGASFDFDMWVSKNGWPRNVNVLWASSIQIGAIPLFSAGGQRQFILKNFFQNYDDLNSPVFPFGTYATNGVRCQNEGADGGPCIKYTIAGAAGTSWIMFKEPVDLSTLADTDIFTISLKLGQNKYQNWLPAPLVLTTEPTPPPTYEIGPGKTYENIGDMPWETLQAGDTVYIYWREQAYQEKFGVDVQGTPEKPVYIHGVPGPDGQLPKIDGNHATTRQSMPLAGQNNRLVGLGNNQRPTRHVIIEHLEICNANKFKMYYPKGQTNLKAYNEFSAGIYVQWGENITIRNCQIHDCANGLFVNSFSNIDYYSGKSVFESEVQYASRDILVESNNFYNNGVPGKMFDHHSYCSAINTTYQFNHYGNLIKGSTGYALKDRGSGTVIRYNWIEDGRRQISLDDAQDCPLIAFDPKYIDSFVYGNILIEPDGGFRVWGDDEIIHFGGDDENVVDRIGTLYFSNNTVVSYRTKETYKKYTTASWATGREPRTCMVYLPFHEQTAELTNNIMYRAGDAPLTMMNDGGTDQPAGTIILSHNWISEGWVAKMEGAGTITDDGTNLTGSDPGFLDLTKQDFHLKTESVCMDQGIVPEVMPEYEYLESMQGSTRKNDGKIDLGAYEYVP